MAAGQHSTAHVAAAATDSLTPHLPALPTGAVFNRLRQQ